MSAVVTLIVTAPAGELADTMAEQLHTLDRGWDDSDDTCERVLSWLRAEQVDHADR